MTAQLAFATLQASAKNFAGLNNARALLREVKNIRRLRYEQLVEEKKQDSLAAEARQENAGNYETVSENIKHYALGQRLTLCDGLQHAA